MNSTIRVTEMTARQEEVHRFMLDYQIAKGKPPTVREIGLHFGLVSPNGVLCHLRSLARKGFVADGGHGESRRFRAVEPYAPLSLGVCAIVLNAAAWKGRESWRVVEDKIKDGEGRVYDLEEARAIAYYLDHAPRSGAS